MKFAAIIPAAGMSTRFNCPGEEQNKLFMQLNGRPLIYWSLEAFSFCDQIIIPTQRELFPKIDEIITRYFKNSKGFEMVVGGATRAESINNAIQILQPDIDSVMIHDAARPLVSHEIITHCRDEITKKQALVVAVKAKETVKEVVDSKIVNTPVRNKLWIAQTPQVFKKDILIKAYAQSGVENVTDDSSLVEKLGVPVEVVEGNYENIKITTFDDYLTAQRILDSRMHADHERVR